MSTKVLTPNTLLLVIGRMLVWALVVRYWRRQLRVLREYKFYTSVENVITVEFVGLLFRLR